MHLVSIEAHHFRNLKGKIDWGRNLNILYGNNGQGKTNWLEAIYLLSRTKSFRTQRLLETVCFGEQFAFVKGEIASGSEFQRELQITVQGNTKTNAVNGKREPLARYLGQFQVFAFTADDLDVVRGMPEARRRFLDKGVASLRPAYVQTLADYSRVMKQKNRILSDASERESKPSETTALLEPWNEQLVSLGAIIHRARTDYVNRLNEVLEHSLFESQQVAIRYLSSLAGKGNLDDYENLLTDRLRLRMQAEVASGHALIGPHRDDLEVLFGGREMRVYGSSGQQRSALLILDLAAISLYNSWYSDYPVFLIDDVDAELDEKRITRLLEHLEGRTQTFITTSKRSHVREFLSRANVYEIDGGEVRPERHSNTAISVAVAPNDS